MRDILWTLAVLGVWAVVHSLLMFLPFKRAMLRLLGPRFAWYRLGFNVWAAVSLVAVWLLLPPLPQVIWRVEWPFSLPLVLLRLAGAAGLLLCFRQFDGAEFLGLAQMRQLRRGTYVPALEEDPAVAQPLETGGLYALCRHPMYFFGLVFLAARSVMTLGDLVLLVGAWAYFELGSRHEETRLVHTYGDAYRRYRETTSRILPVRFVRGLFAK